ncbi:MAG: UTP--glucose-1-phosphate uridylyltransferase [Armatimonadetes bacterium]|nr:UTP--glucose-1-phosphate uridylyltransferase [Armatimonadota bacterium]
MKPARIKKKAPLRITKAVVPAAGRGTRLYPATKSQAKEMLPLGTKPTIQHVVEELAQAGIREILIITGRLKRAIEDHFDADSRWLEELREGKASDEGWPQGVEIFYTRQSQQLGLGDAVSRAKAFCGDEPFVVALGDSVIIRSQPGPGVLSRMMKRFEQADCAACIATYQVAPADTSRYGILTPAEEPIREQAFAVADIVEKPGPDLAPSNWAISARYVFTPEIFDTIEESRSFTPPGEEIQLTDAIRRLIGRGRGVWALPLAEGEVRLDVGDFRSYGRAFTRVMATHPRHGKTFVEYLRKLVAYMDGDGDDPDRWDAQVKDPQDKGEGQ